MRSILKFYVLYWYVETNKCEDDSVHVYNISWMLHTCMITQKNRGCHTAQSFTAVVPLRLA